MLHRVLVEFPRIITTPSLVNCYIANITSECSQITFIFIETFATDNTIQSNREFETTLHTSLGYEGTFLVDDVALVWVVAAFRHT